MRLRTVALLALLLAGTARAEPPAAVEAPAPDCSRFSLEGIRLGMAADEARPAIPDATWIGSGDSWRIERRGDSPLLITLSMRAGRIIRLDRAYYGMAQSGVRMAFLDHFGVPTREKVAQRDQPDIAGLELARHLEWTDETCNARVRLDIADETRTASTTTPYATATLELLVMPPNPSTGAASVKF